jgi:hypothetical protein
METSIKKVAKWATTLKGSCNWNNKGQKAIDMAFSLEEFCRISQCEIFKEACDILEVLHEGTKTVKTSKLQMLASKFEKCNQIASSITIQTLGLILVRNFLMLKLLER